MDIVQLAIQGGAVGIAAFALYVLLKLVGNHINHNTEVLTKLEVAITKLIEKLNE